MAQTFLSVLVPSALHEVPIAEPTLVLLNLFRQLGFDRVIRAQTGMSVPPDAMIRTAGE